MRWCGERCRRKSTRDAQHQTHHPRLAYVTAQDLQSLDALRLPLLGSEVHCRRTVLPTSHRHTHTVSTDNTQAGVLPPPLPPLRRYLSHLVGLVHVRACASQPSDAEYVAASRELVER